MMFASWFRVEWRRNELIWSWNEKLGFWSGLAVFSSCLKLIEWGGKRWGFANIRYACPWLVMRKQIKCPLLKSRMCELYSEGCLEGVWFWSTQFLHIRSLRHGQLPWLRPQTGLFWSFRRARPRNSRVSPRNSRVSPRNSRVTKVFLY
jgi:hypothetical protein